MRLKFRILVIVALMAFGANAQQLAVKWGNSYKNRKNSYITKIVAEGPDSYYALRYSNGYIFSFVPHLWLDKYSGFSLQQEFSKEIEIPTRDGEQVVLEDIYNVGGNMVLLGSYINREVYKKSVFAYTIDTLGNIGKNYREADYLTMENLRDERYENFTLSADSNALMLYHTEYDAKTGNERLICRQIDKNLNEQFYKSIDIPYKKERVSIVSGLCDAEGNFYVMLRIADLREGLFIKETKEYSYLLLAITGGGTIREYDISLGGPRVAETMLKRTTDGDILVAGFYTNQSNVDQGIAGTYYIRIDGKSGQIEGKGQNAFDKGFLELFLNNRKINKGVEISRYQLHEILIQPDQGVILVAEQTFEDLVCFYDGRTGIQTCNNHYYFNDIIVASLAPDGSTRWIKRIPKQQETINDGGVFSSYLLSEHKNKLYFVFNDNVRNFEYTPGNIGIVPPGPFNPYNMTSPQKSEVALVEVDSLGNINKKPLFNSKDNRIIIRPHLAYQPNDDIMVIYGEYGNFFRLGKLIFTGAGE